MEGQKGSVALMHGNYITFAAVVEEIVHFAGAATKYTVYSSINSISSTFSAD